MRKLASMAISLGLILALPGMASADAPQDLFDYLEATIGTENNNLIHYQQVASQATNGDGIPCRADLVFVSQSGIDGRITVQAEDNTVVAVECVDPMLEAEDLIWGWLYIESLPIGADPVTGWEREAETPVAGQMIHGVGVAAASRATNTPPFPTPLGGDHAVRASTLNHPTTSPRCAERSPSLATSPSEGMCRCAYSPCPHQRSEQVATRTL